VLDENLREVPPGVFGELCIGGANVGRGYLRRPAATAAAFVPDPFGRPGERIYRTGDLARWRADGTLEFAGRGDNQVKLRGYRVELGEIETHLARHHEVADAAVAMDESQYSGGRLVAHVVLARAAADSDPDAQTARLIKHLRGLLPGYMVPAAFVFHDALPKTPSGKVDRRALPAPGPQAASTACFLAPRTPVEEQIARSAAELLGVQRVGVHDDFFELGGHSLTAAQLVTALSVSFGVEIAVQDMFVNPTVEHLAALVEAELRRQRHLRDEDERLRSLVADMPDEAVEALVRQLLTESAAQKSR
jgi:acyl carrier protein